jgi:hypothetical protein
MPRLGSHQPAVGGEFVQALLRLAPRGVAVPRHGVVGHAREAHLALEGQFDGVHQHQ